MSHTIIEFFMGITMPAEMLIFAISMLPIVELRGGLIAASLLGVPMGRAFVLCYMGNVLPVPFILLFVKRMFAFLRRFDTFGGFIDRLETRAIKKGDKVVRNRQLVGLFLLVAIPLPGTGAWTGSLVAALLDMDLRKALGLIMLGLAADAVIMLTLTYFIPGLFGI